MKKGVKKNGERYTKKEEQVRMREETNKKRSRDYFPEVYREVARIWGLASEGPGFDLLTSYVTLAEFLPRPDLVSRSQVN